MQVIVHGGAGSSPDDPEPRQAVLDEAVTAGTRNSTPRSAVEAAVRVLESSPRFNAGVGGAVQADGTIRTDAGMMTDEREVGAACSMPGIEHAVSVARAVMEETPHVLLCGEHAVRVADAFGIETDVDLWTERTREQWTDVDAPRHADLASQLSWIEGKFGRSDDGNTAETDGGASNRATGTPGVGDEHDHDTVGAVAREGDRFAAATSTGGRWLALAGRVGDVPQVGSGFYASSAGGASATGAGEDIARVTLSRRAVRHLEDGLDAQDAADRTMAEFAELTGSEAGVIVLDSDGKAGSAFNSNAMQTAVADE